MATTLGYVLGILLVLCVAFGITSLVSLLIMLLWNNSAVPTFGAPELGFWTTMLFVWLIGFSSSLIGSGFRK